MPNHLYVNLTQALRIKEAFTKTPGGLRVGMLVAGLLARRGFRGGWPSVNSISVKFTPARILCEVTWDTLPETTGGPFHEAPSDPGFNALLRSSLDFNEFGRGPSGGSTGARRDVRGFYDSRLGRPFRFMY